MSFPRVTSALLSAHEITKACPLPCLNPGVSSGAVFLTTQSYFPRHSLRDCSWDHSPGRCLHANLKSQSLFRGNVRKKHVWAKIHLHVWLRLVERTHFFLNCTKMLLAWLSSSPAQPESWTRSANQCRRALAQSWGGNQALLPSDLEDSGGEYICGKKPTSSWSLIPADKEAPRASISARQLGNKLKETVNPGFSTMWKMSDQSQAPNSGPVCGNSPRWVWEEGGRSGKELDLHKLHNWNH